MGDSPTLREMQQADFLKAMQQEWLLIQGRFIAEIARLETENEALRRKCEAVEQMTTFSVLHRSGQEWWYTQLGGGTCGATPWAALNVKEGER